jgi:hypothetical protein
LGGLQPSGAERALETRIYLALLDLMDIAGQLTDNLHIHPNQLSHNYYSNVAAVDGELNSWYKRLPPELQWTPESVATAPSSFFLLQ